MQALLKPLRASAASLTLAMIKLAMSRTPLPTTHPVGASFNVAGRVYPRVDFGQPLPSLTHALNAGGIPLMSDSFLLEKQQNFDRSKICERSVLWLMAHVCFKVMQYRTSMRLVGLWVLQGESCFDVKALLIRQ
jgi:hypothetical protein